MAKTLLMADVFDDAEPVVVDTDQPGLVVLELDDGKAIALDARELLAALTAQTATPPHYDLGGAA